MKRMRWSVAVAAALLVIALLSAAVAAVRQWDLTAFFTDLFGQELTEDAQILLQQQTELGSITLEQIKVTVQEAVADGQFLHLGALITPREGVSDLLFLGVDASPQDSYDRFGGGISFTYAGKAKAEGRRMVRASVYWSCGDYSNDLLDFINNEDGSLSYIVSGALVTDAQTVDLDCLVVTYELSEAGEQVDGSYHRETFPSPYLSYP